MATNTQIHCACGSTINSAIPELLNNFDKIHGNVEHQNRALSMAEEKITIGKLKWAKINDTPIVE